jgi:hypothetical protein
MRNLRLLDELIKLTLSLASSTPAEIVLHDYSSKTKSVEWETVEFSTRLGIVFCLIARVFSFPNSYDSAVFLGKKIERGRCPGGQRRKQKRTSSKKKKKHSQPSYAQTKRQRAPAKDVWTQGYNSTPESGSVGTGRAGMFFASSASVATKRSSIFSYGASTKPPTTALRL